MQAYKDPRAGRVLTMAMRSILLSGICVLLTSAKDRSPKVILSVIIDDMGFYDARPTNPNSPTPTLNALAQEGVFLNRHYTYTYCSPTRRSFLTGRYPAHISGVQADVCDNWTPLNMSLLSNKLQAGGYEVSLCQTLHFQDNKSDIKLIND